MNASYCHSHFTDQDAVSEALLENEDEGSAEGDSISDDMLDSLKSEDIKLSLATALQCLRGLFDIGIAVRKLTTRDRFQRALLRSQDIVYAGADRDHVEQNYPKLNTASASWLASRLVKANVNRRKFMIYNERHRERLGAEDDIYDDKPDAPELSSKASTFMPPKSFTDIGRLASGEDCDILSLGTASTSISRNISLRMPTLASLSPDGKPFECPICCIAQRFEKEKAWKYVSSGIASCPWKRKITDLELYTGTGSTYTET